MLALNTLLCPDWSMCQRCVDVFQKLKAIEELKEQQASGKVLQKNQVTRLLSSQFDPDRMY